MKGESMKIFYKDWFQTGPDFGYAMHRRKLRNGLLAIGADLTFDENEPADIDVQVSFPLDIYIRPGRKTVVFTQVEMSAPKDPLAWFNHVRDATAVVTSCRSSAEVISRYFGERVSVIPLGVDGSRFPYVERKPPSSNERFRFLWLNNYECHEKQVEVMLGAWHNWKTQRTRPANAELYIKASGIPGGTLRTLPFAPCRGPVDPKQMFPDVIFDDRSLSAEELTKLIHTSHCYVSTSGGEGWSMGTTESMATGCPVIVPCWSAFRDYCDDSVGYPVREFTLQPFMQKPTDTVPSAFGARLDLNALIATMRWVYDHYGEALSRGKAASERMKQYTWEASAKAFLEICEKYAGARAPEKASA
jgi:glycosyltransferase involved in cell wall biosynthesis